MDTRKASIKRSLPRLKKILESCALCPRRCMVDRTKGKSGFCKARGKPAVYSYSPHHGEEPVLSGTGGSGTIFFTHCNMACCYCQNYEFSQLSSRKETDITELAKLMLTLQKSGCHNINFVSPTHYAAQIVEALDMAVGNGLNIPLVYNTGGYDSLEVIKLLDGIIDVYMPDMRYSDDKMAVRYSGAPDYVKHNRAAVKEMHRQVGDLKVNKEGIAQGGLIIRLLVLPQDISGTVKTLEFIKNEVSKNAYISLMSQYYPTYRACDFKELSRRISSEEYDKALEALKMLGLNNGWIQEVPVEVDWRFAGERIRHKKI